MSYESLDDLPASVRALPVEAQRAYLEAYQASWDTFQGEEGGDMGRAAVAHRDAWSAVLREYEQDDTGEWYPKGEVPEEGAEEDKDEGLIDQIKDVFQ